jgi:hypothetical protein
MKVAFFDRQDEHNPENGTQIENVCELLRIFDCLLTRPPFFCELVGDGDYRLLVGLGGSLGCVQYSRQDGNAPYLMATTEVAKLNNQHVEFLIGNTPTPVPARYCLPFDVVKKISIHFLNTGDPEPAVTWEEI